MDCNHLDVAKVNTVIILDLIARKLINMLSKRHLILSFGDKSNIILFLIQCGKLKTNNCHAWSYLCHLVTTTQQGFFVFVGLLNK